MSLMEKSVMYSAEPADALSAVGVSLADPPCVMATPLAPSTLSDRSTAPWFCGSTIPSKTTINGLCRADSHGRIGSTTLLISTSSADWCASWIA